MSIEGECEIPRARLLFSYHNLPRYAHPAHELPHMRPLRLVNRPLHKKQGAPPSNSKLARCICSLSCPQRPASTRTPYVVPFCVWFGTSS